MLHHELYGKMEGIKGAEFKKIPQENSTLCLRCLTIALPKYQTNKQLRRNQQSLLICLKHFWHSPHILVYKDPLLT